MNKKDFDDLIKKHIERVGEWLDENVQVFPEPKTVTLSEFSIDWDEFSGEFRLSLDSVVLTGKLKFGLEASGKTTFYMPMFHSPLGAPASYPAIEITDRTRSAILKGLQETFPRLKGAGIDRQSGKQIRYDTPPIERIERAALEQAKRKVSKKYAIVVDLETVR